MPRRAIHAFLASAFALALLAFGYASPGLRVVKKKEVEEKLPLDPGLPDGPLPAWVAQPPKTQKVIKEIDATIRERTAMLAVTMGALVRGENGVLNLSDMNAGSPRCPT